MLELRFLIDRWGSNRSSGNSFIRTPGIRLYLALACIYIEDGCRYERVTGSPVCMCAETPHMPKTKRCHHFVLHVCELSHVSKWSNQISPRSYRLELASTGCRLQFAKPSLTVWIKLLEGRECVQQCRQVFLQKSLMNYVLFLHDIYSFRYLDQIYFQVCCCSVCCSAHWHGRECWHCTTAQMMSTNFVQTTSSRW